MYTMLVACGSDPRLRDALARSAAVVRRQIPRLGSEMELVEESLPEAQVGWYYFLPNPAPPRPLITNCSDERHTYLVYGEFFDANRPRCPAEVVRETWSRGGDEAVQRLNGCFSAILIDRRRGVVQVLGDAIGRRTLRHRREGDCWLVATHDVPLVATGLFVPETDLVSAASVVGCDWSVGGHSLLQGVEVTSPTQSLHWEDGELHVRQVPRLSFQRSSKASVAEIGRSLLEELRRGTGLLVGDAAEVEIELTAGLDSRAVLAAALIALGPNRVTAVTRGDAEDIEVHTARTIAARHGIRHRVIPGTAGTGECWQENLRTLAFFMNGDTNGKRAAGEPLRYEVKAVPRLGGAGGEIYRGYYYPRDPHKAAQLDRVTAALPMLRGKFKRLDALPWVDRSVVDHVHWRLDESVGQLNASAESGFDVLDLFYIYERFGRWALGARLPTEESRLFPFENGQLIRLALQLPSPLQGRCNLQRQAVREWLPQAWWLPVNGRRRLPLDGVPGGRSLQRLLNGAVRLRTPRRKIGMEAERAEWLRGSSWEMCRALIDAPGGVGQALFGTDGVAQLLDEHSSGAANHVQVLGFLLTMQTWQQMIGETFRKARQGEPNSVLAGGRP